MMKKGRQFSVELSIETDEDMTSDQMYLHLISHFPKWLTAGSAEIMDGKNIVEILEHELKKSEERTDYLKDQIARIRKAREEES